VTEETELDESRPSRPNGKRVRRNIIDAARALFAEKGYSGAKVEEIVVRARTTKPMIYYYFGSKERLFAAVLEDVYAGMRTIEQSLQLAELPALEAMRKVIEVTFDYHAKNPEWVRLVSIANIHYAKHILASETVASPNSAIVELDEELAKAGYKGRCYSERMQILCTYTCNHISLFLQGFQSSYMAGHFQARP